MNLKKAGGQRVVGYQLHRKPQQRDGHCATIFGDYLVIFGGDRHQNAFNDTYLFDLGTELAERGLISRAEALFDRE